MRYSDARVQGIRDIPEPTSVKSVNSFIGMVNYFRGFISGLSGQLILLDELAKKKSTSEHFCMTRAALLAFRTIKDLLLESSELTIMTEKDPLVLYTDASTTTIGGASGFDANPISREFPCCFVSHALSDQATRWGIMGLELFALL
jgi:RNase H-like domain found in reverse transcriptase